MQVPDECRDLAAADSILDSLGAQLGQVGLVGAVWPTAKILYLAAVSRLLDRPVSVVVKAPSGAGKSWVVKQTLAFFPASAYHALTAMSEHALVYDTTPLVHRMLLVYEADGIAGELASALLRTLLSEGRIRYTTVEKTKDGMRPKTIDRPGPTGLITTTTALKLHPENETRLLSLTVPDTQEQTRSVFEAWGFAAAGGEVEPVDFAPWHVLQGWLEGGPRKVVVPYGPALASLVPPRAVRLRRDFITVLTLVQAHALLHRAKRETDSRGRLRATLQDYEAVREIVGPVVAAGVATSVKPETREAVEAVGALGGDRSEDLLGSPATVTNDEVARRLELDKSSSSRRVADAIEQGYLVNLETHRGRPLRLVLGEVLPDDAPILPSLADSREGG